jgi:hypothetical protein
MPSFRAAHGMDCAPPPAMHMSDTYDLAAFVCGDHLMTSMSASPYGAVVLTPDHMLGFSQGEARIDFDVSTFGQSTSNWIELWLTPFDDVLQLVSGGEASTWGASGHPRNGIGINMESVTDPRDVNSHTAFSGQLIKDFSTQNGLWS